jgi:hypothetical protein
MGDPRKTASRRAGWRVGTLAEESFRNLVARRSKLGGLAGLAVVCGVVTAMAGAADVRALRTETTDLIDAGWSSIEVSTRDPDISGAAISAASCRALAALPGVERVGGWEFIRLEPGIPGVNGEVALIDHTFFTIDGMTADPAGRSSGFAGQFAAELTGRSLLANGDHLIAASPLPTIPGVFPLQSSLTLVGTPESGLVTRCVAVVSDGAASDATLLALQAGVRSVRGDVVARWLGPRPPRTPAEGFAGRSSSWIPSTVGLLLGIAWSFVLRSRSSERATYLLAGSSRTEVAVLLQLEALLIAGFAWSSCVTAAIALDRWAQLAPTPDRIQPAVALAAGFLVATNVIGLMFVRSPIFDLVKDR